MDMNRGLFSYFRIQAAIEIIEYFHLSYKLVTNPFES